MKDNSLKIILTVLVVGDTFLSNSAFGSGDGPILRGFDCQGWEQNMAECFNSSQQYEDAHNLHCNSYSPTAVRCSDCESMHTMHDNTSVISVSLSLSL